MTLSTDNNPLLSAAVAETRAEEAAEQVSAVAAAGGWGAVMGVGVSGGYSLAGVDAGGTRTSPSGDAGVAGGS